VRISNCSVNSPWDDAICPKSSFALGYARPTENVMIANCYVTGSYQVGSLIDGSFKRFPETSEDHGWQRTGRIKCGTESNGGFRNIAIANCVFESCRGLALETVDGGLMEDITVTGVATRNREMIPCGPVKGYFSQVTFTMRSTKAAPITKSLDSYAVPVKKR
jgi:polygalacturonase